MKGAALIRGSHLLSKVHTASICSRIGSIQGNELAPPVAFEIDVSSTRSGNSSPAIKKRLEEASKQEITMNKITQKLTRAHIQRCKVQAEKYSKAKINTLKSCQVKVNRKAMERDNTWSSVKIDRKLDNAIKNRCEVVFEKQNKAKIHNQRVLERIHFVSTEFEKKLDSIQELTQSKLKNAASLRGS
jgi:hypothetical protein